MVAIADSCPRFATECFLVLPDRARVRLRLLQRFEEPPIRELFEHLSSQTRYLRFLSPLRELPESLLRCLVDVDCRRRLALVAEHEGQSGVETVALGSFSAVDGESAEVGLVVRDDWQNRRLGSELAVRLLDAAEACGFHRFIADVAAGNTAIRRIISDLGQITGARASFGVSEVVFIRTARPAGRHAFAKSAH